MQRDLPTICRKDEANYKRAITMDDRRKERFDRRVIDRRTQNEDSRSETEKGIVGERRSGEERRGNSDRRSDQVSIGGL